MPIEFNPFTGTFDIVKPGPKGDPGEPGSAGGTYVHDQDSASDLWVVNHGLGYKPSVTVVDTLDRQFFAHVEYLDDNTLTIDFGAPFTGRAYLS